VQYAILEFKHAINEFKQKNYDKKWRGSNIGEKDY
jgi:hypothetical protein